jgi:hypothetical protein
MTVRHDRHTPGGVTPTTAVDVLANAKTLMSGNRHSVMAKTLDDNTVLTRPDQLVKSRQMQIQTRLTPDSLIRDAWAPTNNAFMDFRIMPSNNIHYADNLTFVLQVTNPQPPGGDFMLLGPWYQMFDRIEILPDGTSTADQIYPLQAFLMTAMTRTDEQRAMAASNEGINRDTNRNSLLNTYQLVNYDAAFQGLGIRLNPGENYTYRFQVGSILDFADMFLPCIQTFPTIRFYFGGRNFQMSTSPTLATDYPRLANAELLVSGTFLTDPGQVSAYKDYYTSYPSISNGIMYDRQTLPPFTPTSNVETADNLLTGLSGKMAGFFLVLKEQNLGNEFQFSPGNTGNQSFKHLDKFTFKQMDGTVQSFEKQDVDWFRTIMASKQWPSCVSLEKCILWYPFCTDPMALYHQGADTGSYQFTTRESFRAIPLTVPFNALTPATQYSFEAFGVRYGQMISHKGLLSAFKMDEKPFVAN